VPGVIGQIGTALGNLGVNIATFALGRRSPIHGAEAVAMVRRDGIVNESVAEKIRAIPSITEARLLVRPAATIFATSSRSTPLETSATGLSSMFGSIHACRACRQPQIVAGFTGCETLPLTMGR
jgi:hypothetical protein